jgi:hypothetical protein
MRFSIRKLRAGLLADSFVPRHEALRELRKAPAKAGIEANGRGSPAFFQLRKKSAVCNPRHVAAAGRSPSQNHRVANERSSPVARAQAIPERRKEMTTIENSVSTKTTTGKASWFRRAVMGAAFAAAAVATLGSATTPAEAYWYHYGYYHPYYAYYPHHYGWYGYYPAQYGWGGWGWRGGWGWHHGWYHHW